MKNNLKFIFILLITFNSFSQINLKLNNMKYSNGNPITECGIIDLGSNSTVTVEFCIDVEHALLADDGEIKVFSKKTSTTSPIQRNTWQINTSAGGWNPIPVNGYYNYSACYLTVTLNALDFNNSGGKLYASFKHNTTGVEIKSCEYSIIKSSSLFEISPTSVTLNCGSVAPTTFTVNNVNNSIGVLTYNWDIGTGWSGSVSSNTNSITLTPTSSNPSSVSVTPILNGVAQQTITSTVSLTAFNPLIQVVGSTTGCTGTASNYSILGSYSVTWSLSNPALGTLSSTTGSSVSLTPTGGGSLTITAIVTNACNQSKSFSKVITVGQPVLSNHTILGGNDNVSTNSYSILNITPATGATSYQWSVLHANDTGSCDTAGGLTPPGVIYPTVVENGSYSKRINWGNCPGYYKVRCTATNSCGIQYYSDKRVTVFGAGGGGNPCGRTIAITPNPIKGDGTITVNIIQPPVDPPCNNDRSVEVVIENIAIYDLKSNVIYSKKFKADSITINDLKLKKGLYIVQATTNDSTVISEKIVIE